MLPLDYGYLHNSIYIVNWAFISVFGAGIAQFPEKDPPLFVPRSHQNSLTTKGTPLRMVTYHPTI